MANLNAGDLIGQFRQGLKPEKSWGSIGEFVQSPKYLGFRVYPKQLTLLRLIYLETEFMTEFDLETIEKWRTGFGGIESHGVQPDIWHRVKYLKDNGYRRFPHVQNVMGRRGSKGWIGGVLGAEQVAYMVALGNWQKHYGIQAGKTCWISSLATNFDQAKKFLFADISEAINSCAYLRPYINVSDEYHISLYTPNDQLKIAAAKANHVSLPNRDLATIRIVAMPASSSSGRGGVGLANFYDEFAFMLNGTNGPADSDNVYGAYQPALKQFRKDALTYIPSSPLTKVGKFFSLYQDGSVLLPSYLAEIGEEIQHLDEDSKESVADPTMLIYQGPSWGLYESWEQAPALLGYKFDGPGIEYDEQMVREERKHPAKFKVEYRGQFSEVQDAYLDPEKVDRIFIPFWGGRTLEPAKYGRMDVSYFAHADPSTVNANFAFCIGHLEEAPEPDEYGELWPHVIIDYLKVWKPADFPDHTINYVTVGKALEDLVGIFPSMDTFTTDQFNCLSGDTWIPTDQGLKRLSSLFGDDEGLLPDGTIMPLNVRVQSRTGIGSGITGCKKGKRDTLVFTTKLHSTLECTPEHQMLTKKHNDDAWMWKQAGEIGVGDFVMHKKNLLLAEDMYQIPMEFWGSPKSGKQFSYNKEALPKFIDQDFAQILGYLISEGDITNNSVKNKDYSISFGQEEGDVLEHYASLFERVFPDFGLSRSSALYEKTGITTTRIRTSSKILHHGLEQLGFIGNSYVKTIPQCIMKSPEPVVASFIQAMFEGDGGVANNRGGRSIVLSSTSGELIWQTQQLMFAMGIYCRIQKIKTPKCVLEKYKVVRSARNAWSWKLIIDGPDIEVFATKIGFTSARKKAELNTMLAENRALKTPPGHRRKNRVIGDEFAVRVHSIEASEAVVYDISVPEYANFVANGLVVHNSAGILASLKEKYGRRTRIKLETYTKQGNMNRTEKFKSAINLGWVHSYKDEFFGENGDQSLLEQELKFLSEKNGQVVKQEIGPITTKDLADCVMSVTVRLLEKSLDNYQARLMGSLTPGLTNDQLTRVVDRQSIGQKKTTREELNDMAVRLGGRGLASSPRWNR